MTPAELANDPDAAIVEGVDVDAVANTVRACAGVSELVDGPFGDSTSYLPGRRVTGVLVSKDMVRVSVRARWGVPTSDLLDQITSALKPTLANRRIEVVVADIDHPPWFAAQPPVAVPRGAGPTLPAGYPSLWAGLVASWPAVHEAGSLNDPQSASGEPGAAAPTSVSSEWEM
jgi:hypothetical protein